RGGRALSRRQPVRLVLAVHRGANRRAGPPAPGPGRRLARTSGPGPPLHRPEGRGRGPPLWETAPMQGDPDVIELLNEVLTAELTAVNQYFLDARMLENWGYVRLAERFRSESIDE